MKTKFRRLYSSIAALLLMCVVGQASATLIGPGVGLTGAALDTQDNNGRINIDNVGFVNFAAGNYQATTFSFDAGSDSTVTAFLALLTGTDTYEVIAASLFNVNAGQDQSLTFGGPNNLFTLAASANVYAGIATFGAPNPIQFSGGSTTDHDNNLSLASIGIGTVIDGFSHLDLRRQYNFEIDVSSVPEPGSLLLLGMGIVGLGFTRRKKKV